MKKYTIAVAGIGYVGLANAILLAQHNKVYMIDIIKEKVDMINRRECPITDKEMLSYLSEHELDLTATCNSKEAYSTADFIFVATPTNYSEKRNYFDTSSVEQVIEQALDVNPQATIVIKSTVPIGYTEQIYQRYPQGNFIFIPEFLREGRALYDNLYPSRIVIGTREGCLKDEAEVLAGLFCEGALKKEIRVIYTQTTEAEAIKLFSNTYLAMRVAFFNELDTYAECKGLNTKQIIESMSMDPRIGGAYNNPSFGYGGYCLPKDSKQMVANYQDIPNDLIKAIVNSNQTRKAFITERILTKAGYPERKDIIIGIYRLTMKAHSDNFRESAITGVLENIINHNVKAVIYEPMLRAESFEGCKVINDFDQFSKISTIIVANRMEEPLKDVWEKVYTRDIYEEN